MMRGLYGIADDAFGEPVALGAMLLAGGVCALQLRCKRSPEAAIEAALRTLRPLCAAHRVPLIINDRAGLAGLADGVHLGQEDGPFPKDCGLRGRSTHDLDQVRRAMDEDVDYIGFGPVFSTRTKAGAGEARGLARVGQAARLSTVPVVAIGGITPARLPAVRQAGAACWAIVSAILADPDPIAIARRCGQ